MTSPPTPPSPAEPPTPGENTRAVHLPPSPVPSQAPLGGAVWRSSTFAFGTSQEYADVLGDRAPGYTYSRIDNPTSDGFAAAVAALEGARIGGVTGQAFASARNIRFGYRASTCLRSVFRNVCVSGRCSHDVPSRS